MNDTSKNSSVKKVGGSNEAQLSFTELQLLMSIGIDLEDQLWAMTQSPQVPSSVKNLWAQAKSRTHTAYGRLASLVQLADSEEPFKLAELGLVNEGDKQKRFMHYQEPHVPLESIY